VEAFFEALKALVAEMEEEERRAAREGLTEDELAIFDLLTRPEPKLTKPQETAVKKVARELLEKLQEQLVVAQWQAKQRDARRRSEHHSVHAERAARGAVSRAAVEREGGRGVGIHLCPTGRESGRQVSLPLRTPHRSQDRP
jgi:hypothetical protein